MNHDNETDRTQEKLVEAWRSTPAPVLPTGWKASVMRDVRSATPPPHAEIDHDASAFEHAARVGAIAASLLAFAAIAAAILTGLQPSDGLFVVLRSSPESLLEWILVL